MNTMTLRAYQSLRRSAHLNLTHARAHKAAGETRMLTYRFRLALQCRRDANELRTLSR